MEAYVFGLLNVRQNGSYYLGNQTIGSYFEAQWMNQWINESMNDKPNVEI